MIQDIVVEIWIFTKEVIPYLLLSFLLAGLIHEFVPSQLIARYLGKGVKSILLATFAGIPLPICVMGSLMMGIEFHKKGADLGSTFSFFVATPATSITAILVMFALFDPSFIIFFVISVILTAIIIGIVLSNMKYKKSLENLPSKPQSKASENRIMSAFRYGFGHLGKDFGPTIAVGIILAGIIASTVPSDLITTYLGAGLLPLCIALIIALPLHICPVGSVPFLAALIGKGMSPGAALIFLIAGPSTNIPAILVLRKAFGLKVLLSFIFIISLCAILFGYGLNTIF